MSPAVVRTMSDAEEAAWARRPISHEIAVRRLIFHEAGELPEPKKQTKTAQIERILRDRYSCQEVPHGHLKQIAAEIGCTRELVRKVALRLAMRTGVSHHPNCVGCGKEIPHAASAEPVCRVCNRRQLGPAWVDVKCNQCDVMFKRPRSQVLMYPGQRSERYRGGRMFCSRPCWNEFQKRPRAEWMTQYAGKSLKERGAAARATTPQGQT